MKVYDWRPDWRNDAAYEFMATAPPEIMAWQFLRRNEKYQQAWNSFQNESSNTENAPYLRHRREVLGESWYLKELCDPVLEGPSYGWRLSRFAKLITKSRKKENYQYVDLGVKDKRAYGFDLTREIPPQIDAVKADLLELQELLLTENKIAIRKSGQRPGDYKLYLRILDAIYSGASHADIMEALEPYRTIAGTKDGSPIERLKDNLKAARKLVRKEYSTLLLRTTKN